MPRIVGTRRGADADQPIRWAVTDTPQRAGVTTRPDGEPGSGSTYRTLAQVGDVSIVDVRCRWHAGARMRERFQSFGLSLVRQGFFVRHVRRGDEIGDSTTALFEQPGREQLVSHPLQVSGSTTVIVMAAEAMARYAGDLTMPDRPIPISPAVHVEHATLLGDLRTGIDGAELDARLTWLIGRLVETGSPGRLTSLRAATARSHQRIVDHVREAIASDPAVLDLRGLAAELGHTPFHVSRVFRRTTGTTLIQHRNNVRVAVAIDRLGEGHESLARLAAELGFCDQSHLSRVLRRSVQLPPGRLRDRLFRGGRPAPNPDNDVQDQASASQ